MVEKKLPWLVDPIVQLEEVFHRRRAVVARDRFVQPPRYALDGIGLRRSLRQEMLNDGIRARYRLLQRKVGVFP